MKDEGLMPWKTVFFAFPSSETLLEQSAPLASNETCKTMTSQGTNSSASSPQSPTLTHSPILTPQQLLELSTELFARGLSVRFRAPGWSMHPTIDDGEVITVEPIEASEVKKGDIILYRVNDGVIAHRVVRIEMNESGALRFTLRGDAARDCDEPVGSHQVLGRVVLVERQGRHVNPYSRKSKIVRTGHTWASRVKRGIIRISHSLRGRYP